MMDLQTTVREGWFCGANQRRQRCSFSALHTWAQAARELPRYLLIEYSLSIIAQNKRIESRNRPASSRCLCFAVHLCMSAGCCCLRVSEGRVSVHVMLNCRAGKAGLHKPHFSGRISNCFEMDE
jgi:hypothetical protein